MSEDTQEEMVPFNFGEPFNVTVTIDDSDNDDDDKLAIQKEIEESSRLIKKRQEDNVVDNNNLSLPDVMNVREENSVKKPNTSTHPELKRKINSENNPSIPIQSEKTKMLKSNRKKENQGYIDSLVNCKDDLLKTIIEHVTYIMEAHVRLVVFPFRQKDTKNLKYSEFKKKKYHLFELSYSTVKCLLVPFEKDPNLMTNLMHQILKTASENKGINCYGLKDLQKLFDEMIGWTKEKMRRLQCIGLTDHHTSHSKFTAEKNEAVKESDIIQPSFRSVYAPTNLMTKEPNTCLFSCGPSNNPLNISIDTSTLNRYQTQCPNVSVVSSNKTQTENTNNHQYTQNYIPERYNIPVYNQPVNKPQNNSYLIRLLNEQPKTYPLYYDIYKDLVESSKSFAPPEIFTATENQVAAETSRSKSTDSGFISPPPYPEQLLNNIPENQNTAMTPYVTHVTSLNPHAEHLNYGRCFICGKTTNKMCVGCFKHYYCSHKCQETHWFFHKYDCNNKELT